jgi:hypothetical protein
MIYSLGRVLVNGGTRGTHGSSMTPPLRGVIFQLCLCPFDSLLIIVLKT